MTFELWKTIENEPQNDLKMHRKMGRLSKGKQTELYFPPFLDWMMLWPLFHFSFIVFPCINVREHSHMTSNVFGSFLSYLPTLIRYLTTKAYLVKSDSAWPTYLPKNLTSYVNAPELLIGHLSIQMKISIYHADDSDIGFEVIE